MSSVIFISKQLRPPDTQTKTIKTALRPKIFNEHSNKTEIIKRTSIITSMYGLLICSAYTAWVQKSPLRPAVFWHFSQTVNNFKSIFTHLLYVPICARLEIFIQLVYIICSKCPPSAKTDVVVDSFVNRCLWHINTFIMSTNMLDMTWRQQWRHLLSKQT